MPLARPPSALLLVLACALATPARAGERSTRSVPALRQSPRVDGDPKELTGALVLPEVKPAGVTASLVARVAHFRDTLVLGVTVTDDQVEPNDLLDVLLSFSGAGPTARGHAFRFSMDGQRTPDPEVAAPDFAQRLMRAAVRRTSTGLSFEIALPARALPRFPAKGPMVLDLCLTWSDRDAPAQGTREVSNCRHGSMVGEALALPDTLRGGLKLKPPPAVVALEPKEKGWVGYARLHSPAWVQADVPLTHELLRAMVAERPVDPEAVGLGIPPRLRLPDGRSIYTVVTGNDPFAAANGGCEAGKELRLGLYLVQGKTADQVLEWPAASCALGRMVSVGLDEEGALTLGYSSGATVSFIWSGDHFERTELGRR